MTESTIPHVVVRLGGRATIATCLALSIGACTPVGDFSFGSRNADTASPAAIGATPLEARDVEAPEVFDVTDNGLWDGRPSLGGVWVAHPEATDPERVMIRNTETGRFIIGALFRRERENPGPVIQISSDAAEALDILAGSPTELRVTAMRRVEVAPEPEQEPEMPIADAADVPIADSVEPEATTDAEIVAASLPVDEPAEAARPNPLTGLAALFRRPDAAADATPDTAAVPDQVAEPTTATSVTAPPVITRMSLSAEDVRGGIVHGNVPQEAIEAMSALEERDAEAAMPSVELASLAESAITQTELAAAAPAPTVSQRAATAPVRAATLEQPFVQIGIFNLQENAHNTGQALRRAGLLPTIYDQTSNGRQFWRVVVGPAPNADDRAAVLETVRGLGFEDAYFVAR